MVNKVIIVGRANVGKSTLFSRLTGSSFSLVDKKEGTTRDLLQLRCNLNNKCEIDLLDSGGVVNIEKFWNIVNKDKDIINKSEFSGNELDLGIIKQVYRGLNQSDGVVLLIDLHRGLNEEDKMLVRILYKLKKPFIVVINKNDGKGNEYEYNNFFSLARKVIPISAKYGRGIGTLRDEIFNMLLENGIFNNNKLASNNIDNKMSSLKVAVMGAPNVGKSSFSNSLLDYENSLVSSIEGTTLAVVKGYKKLKGLNLELIDTAGIRRKRKISNDLEKTAVGYSLFNIQKADIIVFIMVVKNDYKLSFQDKKLLNLFSHKTILILVNKIDLIPLENRKTILRNLEYELDNLRRIKIIPVSVKYNLGINKVINTLIEFNKLINYKITTSTLNKIMNDAVLNKELPLTKDKKHKIKILYATQVNTNPIVIRIYGKRLQELPKYYLVYLKRYIYNSLNLDYRTALKILVDK